MARANCRAVAPATEFNASPSRKWAWKSSGRVIEIVSAIEVELYRSSLLHPERHLVERVALAAGDLHGDRDGLLDGEFGKQRLEHDLRIQRITDFRCASLDHENKLAAPAVVVFLDPRLR